MIRTYTYGNDAKGTLLTLIGQAVSGVIRDAVSEGECLDGMTITCNDGGEGHWRITVATGNELLTARAERLLRRMLDGGEHAHKDNAYDAALALRDLRTAGIVTP